MSDYFVLCTRCGQRMEERIDPYDFYCERCGIATMMVRPLTVTGTSTNGGPITRSDLNYSETVEPQELDLRPGAVVRTLMGDFLVDQISRNDNFNGTTLQLTLRSVESNNFPRYHIAKRPASQPPTTDDYHFCDRQLVERDS